MKIIVLLGKSSCGKDTMYKRLLEVKDLNLHRLVPYTTRPMRKGEEDGVEYFFVTEEDFQELLEAGKIIEHRSYATVSGLWRYFTVCNDQLKASNNYLLIGTLESYTFIKDYFGSDTVIPIYIEVDDKTRLERAMAREYFQSNPNYKEMCRRFIADDDDFSKENLKKAGITKVFSNSFNIIDICADNISNYLKGILN